jgi:hypothetical protein
LADIDLSGPSKPPPVGPTDDAFALLDNVAFEFLTTTTEGFTDLKNLGSTTPFFGFNAISMTDSYRL